MEDSIVIKVIYEDKVRRFNARIINKKLLDLSFDGLRAKIDSLFMNFAHDINELTLTYIDEDGDVVTLADDEDLQDIVNQSLNPLRITVTDQIIMTKLHDQSKAFFAFESKPTNLDKKDKGKKINMTMPKVAKDVSDEAHSISEGSTHYFAEPSIWGPTPLPSIPLPSIWSPNTQFPSMWGPNQPEVANNITKGKDFSDEAHSISNCSTHYFAEPSIWSPNTHFPSMSPFPPFYSSGVFTPPPLFEANPRSRSITGQNDGTEIIYHHGIRCNGCGVHPITGPRFMSKEKMDYDLCTKCFSEMGKDTDYIKQDRAMEYQPHISHQVSRGLKVKSSASNLDSEFVMDVNIVDGTSIEPLAPFLKIWRMRNNGKVAWPHKTQLVWVGGDNLSTMSSRELNIPVTGLGVGQELDVFVDFIAPELPGRYVSYWRMASPYGKKFGQRIWALIQVDASLKKTQPESVSGLNLNIPPIDTSSSVSGPQTVSVESNSTAKDKKQNLAQCPITFSEPAPTCLPSFLMKGGVGVEKCFEEGDVKDNESYGEEDSFGDKEWDTILVELEEMGFDDVEKNKVLLKKNNGSIKGVVMDLIDGEEVFVN